MQRLRHGAEAAYVGPPHTCFIAHDQGLQASRIREEVPSWVQAAWPPTGPVPSFLFAPDQSPILRFLPVTVYGIDNPICKKINIEYFL